ncbi:hypothetical protein RCH10_000789 [Variovorax sp. GrIS 2.14]|uniref:hypothetical protein n=1 Tax=Variovorax sp. GrIS 2.14 TaxID=3071709 RepID=UPI0038F5F9A1
MKALLVVTEKGLRGATPDDHEAYLKFKRRLAKSKPGACVRFEWSSPRHVDHHQKFGALLSFLSNNHAVYDTTEKALVALKLAAGFFEPHVDPATLEVIKVPTSIAFESMGQDDFERFYNAAIDALLAVILPRFEKAEMLRLLDQIYSGWIADNP